MTSTSDQRHDGKVKVLITGAAGFIAPHLAEACLEKGWKVLGIDVLDCAFRHPDFTFQKKDVRDLTLDELKGIDYVFHLAFITNIPNSIKNPVSTTCDNIDMTVYLLELSTRAGIRKFVFPSTASLYGENPTPWREDMPPYPIEPYSWQKLSCEYACATWSRFYGLPTVILRLFQVFGENQRHDTSLAAFFRARKEGRPITLTETTAQSSFRTGQRDFIYVKDVADAFVKAAETGRVGKGEIINIGSGKVTTMEEIANAISGSVVFIPRRKFEVERHEADTARARELLGWHPKVEVIPWLTEFVKSL